MKHRLYIVEGLPCSGKSTTAKFAADIIGKGGEKVSYTDEGGGNHPADYEFHSFVTEEDLALFADEEREQVKSKAEYCSGGYVVPLSQFGGKLFDKLLQYKIYDFLPWETEKTLMLRKWREFCNNADNDTVYVFNCCLLQNPMCETMMRFGFPMERSAAYIKEIAEIIKPLDPVVIYLKNDDIAECVRKTAAEREGWLDGVIEYHTNGAYGKSISAQGFDGYIQCLEERQRRELSILSGLPVKSFVIENAHRDWTEAYDKISRFLIE